MLLTGPSRDPSPGPVHSTTTMLMLCSGTTALKLALKDSSSDDSGDNEGSYIGVGLYKVAVDAGHIRATILMLLCRWQMRGYSDNTYIAQSKQPNCILCSRKVHCVKHVSRCTGVTLL